MQWVAFGRCCLKGFCLIEKPFNFETYGDLPIRTLFLRVFAKAKFARCKGIFLYLISGAEAFEYDAGVYFRAGCALKMATNGKK